MKLTTRQRTSIPLTVIVTLDITVSSARYMIGDALIRKALSEFEGSRLSHYRGIYWISRIPTLHLWKINTCLKCVLYLRGVFVSSKFHWAPDIVEFVLGRFSDFNIAITYSNSKFCGARTPSFCEFTSNFSKTSTPQKRMGCNWWKIKYGFQHNFVLSFWGRHLSY